MIIFWERSELYSECRKFHIHRNFNASKTNREIFMNFFRRVMPSQKKKLFDFGKYLNHILDMKES